MDTQPLLIAAPKTTEHVATVEGVLDRANGWLFARELLLAMSLADTPAHRRWLKACAAESRKIVTGNRGYCHRSHATLEEIDHSANRLISWGKAMIKRGIAQKHAAHAALG